MKRENGFPMRRLLNMNEEIEKLLTRAVRAETQAVFLYTALQKIQTLGFGKEYEIASSACNAYEHQTKAK